MRINSEFLRYGWTELSMHRLVAAPLVLAVIFMLVMESESRHMLPTVAQLGGLIYFVLVPLWGGHKAADAMADEVNGRTWDFQRLSSLSPRSLALGKLFGSTVYCWYAGLLALEVSVWAQLHFLPAGVALRNAWLMVAGGILCHGGALLSALMSMQARHVQKLRPVGHHFVGILLAWPFLSAVVVSLPLGYRAGRATRESFIHWAGWEFETAAFMSVLALLMIGWVVTGLYWKMREQLRMQAGPYLWAAFVVFLILLFSQLSWPGVNPIRRDLGDSAWWRCVAAYIVAHQLLIVIVLVEKWNGLSYRKLLKNIQHRQWRTVANLMPRWVVTLAILLVTALLVMVAADWYSRMQTKYSVILLASLVFCLRDILILHYFRLRPDARRATGAALFYLAILYVLLPIGLSVLGLRDLTPLFSVAFYSGSVSLLPIGSALVQSVLAAFFVRHQLQRYWTRPSCAA